MKDVNFNAYHATDQKCLDGILKEGFIYKPNKDHWLGNGVYFFIEYELALWWSSTKHKKYGEKIKKPIIIEANLNCNNDCVVDFRLVKDYNWLSQRYDEFYKEILDNGCNEITDNQLRCLFFDWLKTEYDIKIVIGGFYKNHKSKYLHYILPDSFCLPFIEYQVCVYDNSVLSIKNVLKEWFGWKQEKAATD